MFSPLYLLFMNSDCILETSLSKTVLSRLGIPGLFPFFIYFNASPILYMDNLFSKVLVSSSESFTVSSFFKISSS